MADLNNLMHASNPSTGDCLVKVLAKGLEEPRLIPSFYHTTVSPAVKWHTEHPMGVLFHKKEEKMAYKMAACAAVGAVVSMLAFKLLSR